MLTKEDNDILTRVGPGTPMGNLLRRYWTPVILSSQVLEPDSPPIRVRILGENLIAFRDTSGQVGLVEENCPHRGASVFFGRNEEDGLRCVYHGWKFDVTGACVDMPSEPAESNFKNKVRIGSYPTMEAAGLVFAYMGPPDKQPAFRDFGELSVPREQWRAFRDVHNCNWVQRFEGNIDTAHISWLHSFEGALDRPDDGTDEAGTYPSWHTAWKIWTYDRAPGLEVEEVWHGFKYVGLRNTPNGNREARVGAWILPYNTVVPTIPYTNTNFYCVPVDDYSCYTFRAFIPPNEADRMAQRLAGVEGQTQFFDTPYVNRPRASSTGLYDENGRRLLSLDNDYAINRDYNENPIWSGIDNFAAQDSMATESPGAIWDRTREHLGTTDKAIIKMRQLLIGAAKGLAKGIEPPVLDPDLPYREIRASDKILAPNEDWRTLGTAEDPMIQRVYNAVSIEASAG